VTGAGHCHRVAVRICVGLAGGGPRANQGETRRYLGLHTAATVSVIELHAAGPVAFNALAAGSDADVVVLLEAGALVGPRWLDHLSAALERPGCGLAGPSTNRAWNEQACVRGARADLTSVRRDAARLSSRYGAAARSLAPLHSLGDFCFAVRREVIDAVGAADPAYQEGPCWEMDYSARAARAGFAGLWAGAAYVYRSPVPVSSPQADLDAQEQNLRIYQDRLCGLRLRGTADGYREHCLGDACEHFAPADLITIRLPLTAPREHESVGIPPPVPAAASPTPARRALPFRAKTSAPPLVSALMVTRDRPELALKAVEYFQRQDYPNRELVIIEDGEPLLADRLRHRGSPLKRHVSLTHRTVLDTVGTLRLFRQAARLLHDLPIRPSGHQSGRRAADRSAASPPTTCRPPRNTTGAGSFGVNGCSYALSSCGLLIFGSGWVRVFRCQICLEPATRPEPKPAPSNNSKPSDTTSPSSRSNRPDNQTPKSITAASPVVADEHVTNQGGHQLVVT